MHYMKSSGPLRHRFFFFLLLCLCREICWHGWHLFGCVTFLTRFQLKGWEGRREEVAGWAGSCSFTTARGFFFSCVCENAKRAAAYNGGVMGEAVRRRLGKRHIRFGVKEKESPELFCFPRRCSLESPCENTQKHHGLHLTMIHWTEGLKNSDISFISLFKKKKNLDEGISVLSKFLKKKHVFLQNKHAVIGWAFCPTHWKRDGQTSIRAWHDNDDAIRCYTIRKVDMKYEKLQYNKMSYDTTS